MASVDGSLSLNVASDEIYNYFCDPCKYEGNQREGTKYCENCLEYMCHSCVEYHKRCKPTRDHKIVSAKAVSNFKAKPPGHTILCACEHGLGVTVFCEDHNDIICQRCKNFKHRSCKITTLQEKSSGYAVSDLDTLSERIIQLQNELKAFQQDRYEDIQRVRIMAENCRKEIRACRKEFELHFIALEETILSHLDEYAQILSQEIDRHMSTFSDTEKLLEKDAKLLDDMRDCDNDAMIYAADVRISNHLKDLQLFLHDIQKKIQSPVLEFKRNQNLVDIKENIKQLGSLEMTHYHDPKTAELSFVNMPVDSSSQIQVKLQGDKETPWLSGCTFMSDGQLLLCDNHNNNIKLLNSNFDIKEKLGLKRWPCDVAAVDCSTAIVTTPDSKKLQFIQVVPHLAADRVIQIDRYCWGIDVVDGIIYTICHDNPGNTEIYVLNMTGKILRKIGKSTVSKSQYKKFKFKYPDYLTVSKASKQIYVSDWASSILTCLKPDGTVLYRYRDTDLSEPAGTYIDDNDNVLVCDSHNNHMHIVTPDGKKHGLLVISDDALWYPMFLAYRHSDRTLVVGGSNGKLVLFKLTK